VLRDDLTIMSRPWFALLAAGSSGGVYTIEYVRTSQPGQSS
jgi:hypothetical protein